MSNNRRTSTGSTASSLMAVDRIIAKEKNYREEIHKNHTHMKVMAEHFFAQDCDLEEACVKASTNDEQKETVLAAFQEQRARLKAVSEKNVHNMRLIQAFVGTLQTTIRPTIQAGEEHDYEQLILSKIQEYKHANKDSELEMKDETMVREIMAALGEPTNNHGAAANGNGDDDSEDELQVLRGHSTESFKCPIMGTFLQNPVKNSVCGHVYSREGIMDQIRRATAPRQCRCPIAGCSNNHVTPQQLEDDYETEMKVKRHRRREEHERAQRMTQDLVDDSDED